MQTFYIEKISEIRNNLAELERKLKVKVQIVGRKVTIDSEDGMAEYEAANVLDAIQFGFSFHKAIALADPEIVFRKMNYKDFTRRKDMEEVRGRVIGTYGKTKNTIEQIADCEVHIGETAIGFICHAESIEEATTAVRNLIKGSKQANVYRFLERMNAEKKKQTTDLGLKREKKDGKEDFAEENEDDDEEIG
jgi:KH domain-containing protein